MGVKQVVERYVYLNGLEEPMQCDMAHYRRA